MESVSEVVTDPGRGKELEYPWHIFLEFYFFCVCVVWGPMCVGKDGPEAANGSFTDGSLTISLLGFWA